MADRNEELRARLVEMFRVEAAEHLGEISRELDAIAGGAPAADAGRRLEAVFRAVHTLKGAARSIGFGDVEQLGNRTESLLRRLTTNRQLPDGATIAALREVHDVLDGLVAGTVAADRVVAAGDLLDRLDARMPMPGARPPQRSAAAGGAPPAVSPAAASGPSTTSVRVELERLDRLSVLSEELLIPKLAATERVKATRDLVARVGELRGAVKAVLGAHGRNTAGGTAVDEAVRHMEVELRRLYEALRLDDLTISTTVNGLVEEARRIRMLPAASILDAFPRMVRDICRELGKDVELQVRGADLEVDRKVLDLIKDPLIHLVRNAIDHGIESAEARVAAGKPARGRIGLSFTAVDGGKVAIEVVDDGRGIDVEGLREAIVRARVISSAEAAAMGAEEVAAFAFHSGISTSPVITSISGQGLGLAIVRERVERLEGRLEHRSVDGGGTTMAITLPTTIATGRGLHLRVGDLRALWPFGALDHVIGVARAEVEDALARGLLRHDGESLPFARLGPILGVRHADPRVDERRHLPGIVVRGGGRRGILLVDEVLGDQEVMLKELRAPLRRVANVASIGVLGTGELVPVLRPSDVLASIHTPAGGDAAADPAAALRPRHVLVVDDSITTRTMERNLLEAGGYVVRVAADGEEAWTILRSEAMDLVVSDVDMPRLDGFELTARIRADPQLGELPVVLVTALESREDKERGVRVGANAYVLKSSFDQTDLLEIVGRLI